VIGWLFNSDLLLGRLEDRQSDGMGEAYTSVWCYLDSNFSLSSCQYEYGALVSTSNIRSGRFLWFWLGGMNSLGLLLLIFLAALSIRCFLHVVYWTR